MRAAYRWTAGAAVATLLLAGCATGAAPSGPIQWDDELDLGVPGDLVGTQSGVEFYPACGNEVLLFEDEAWYPYTPSNLEDFAGLALALPSTGRGLARASAAVLEVAVPETAVVSLAVPAVVAPEPGDDTGRLTRYEGGFAYWVSDNGSLSTWLTTTEIEYGWVC